MFGTIWGVGTRRRTDRGGQAHRNPGYHRRLVCEPLEDRRLLSATFPSGAFNFVAEGNYSGTAEVSGLIFNVTVYYEGPCVLEATATYTSTTLGTWEATAEGSGVATWTLFDEEDQYAYVFGGNGTASDTDGNLLVTAWADHFQDEDFSISPIFEGATGTVDWELFEVTFTWEDIPIELVIDDSAVEGTASGTWVGQITVLGRDQIGVHRGNEFYLDYNGNERWDGPDVDKRFRFGITSDTAVIGDWNGDGMDQIGVHRGNEFYLDYNGNGRWDGPSVDKRFRFGIPGDTPIVGDWNGDGKDQIGVHRGNEFYLDYNDNGRWDGPSVDKKFRFGITTDTAVIGDWNGDGRDQIGVHRGNEFYLDYNGNERWDGPDVDKRFRFGITTDTAIIGDWNGDGRDQIGVHRGNEFYLDYNGNERWDGPDVDKRFRFGIPGDTPIVGNWSGGQPLHAAGLPADTVEAGPALDEAALEPIAFAAIADWTTLLDLGAERLGQVEFVIADLPGTMLGLTRENTIYLDHNAAGFGWFIDSTPGLDEEFEPAGSGGGLRAVDSALAERMDLLTVVSHELGHVLGLPDLDPLADSLMGSTLQPGQRYRPGEAERDAYFAALA